MYSTLQATAALALVAFTTLSNLQSATAQILPPPLAATQSAKPLLHSLFTDNMVLQREIAAPVWGWAEPGKKITVSLLGTDSRGTTSKVTVGGDGKWMTKIGPFKAGGPYTLSISGPQKVTLKNVMVGDVWICSGQSNMEMGMGAINAPADIAAANNPNIRLFSVPRAVAYSPRDLAPGKWDVSSPETVARAGWGGFSAVAYFFGKNLQESVNVPIGLIHASWGGTIAEAWTSAEALKSMPEFAPSLAQVKAQADNQDGQKLAELMNAWWQKNDPGTAANWQDIAYDASQWKTMDLPARWEEAGLPSFDGVVWFRKEVTIPESWASRDLTLHLGPVDDNETTFFNGVPVGSTQGWETPRSYKVPAKLVKAGRNVLAVRVLDTGGGGGLHGNADAMKIETPGLVPIALTGTWFYRESVALVKTEPSPLASSNNPNVTTVLYNGMIAPLVPFGIKGAIWYQGESNVGRAGQYKTLLPTMIRDWRNRFGVGEFPFFIVQLANFTAPQEQPAESEWAELREAQAHTAKTLSNTGLAVAIDIGEASDIHPKNKQEVGRRLALAAQAMAYGQKIEHSGPVFQSMKVQDGKIRLSFTHADGLAPKGQGKLLGFAIAGDDKKWVWADAVIDEQEVVVFSASVPNPRAVRYNWANNPNGNLINGAALPAIPFRTDTP